VPQPSDFDFDSDTNNTDCSSDKLLLTLAFYSQQYPIADIETTRYSIRSSYGAKHIQNGGESTRSHPTRSLVACHPESKKHSQLLNLLTFGLWSKLGRLTHYAFDAVLCMCLALSSPAASAPLLLSSLAHVYV